MGIIWDIHPESPDKESIESAARYIKGGKSVIIPTRCLYGIAVDAFNVSAIKKLFHMKQRVRSNPILVLIHHPDQLNLLVKTIPPAAEKLMARFWPGQVTIIFKAQQVIPDEITAKTGKIGVRLVGHPVTKQLIEMANTPLTGTSANISGQNGCQDLKYLDVGLLKSADGALNAGILSKGIGSTVVDTAQDPIKIVREGLVSKDQILKSLG